MSGKIAGLVYPEFDTEHDTFWSLREAMKVLAPNRLGGVKRTLPPLGLMGLGNHLLTNGYYEKVYIFDRNIDNGDLGKILKDHGVEIVLMGGMLAQEKGMVKDARTVKQLGLPLVIGGTIVDERIMAETNADYGVVNEAEMVIDQLLAGVASGSGKGLYYGTFTPPDKFWQPDYSLIDPRDYASYSLQTNRGCVFNCEFCDIWKRYGRVIRTAPKSHIENALLGISKTGFRGSVFIVDDNHVADLGAAMEVQKIINDTEKKIGYKLGKYTQVPLNLSEETGKMRDLRKALNRNAFYWLFIGVESSNRKSLEETGKRQNIRGEKTLEEKLRLIEKEVGGVIGTAMHGFDNDDRQTLEDFAGVINRTGAPIWMAGLQMPLAGTELEKRLRAEGRLMSEGDGNNSTGEMKYITMNMSPKQAEQDFLWLLKTIYEPDAYFARVMREVATTHPAKFKSMQSFKESMASARSVLSGKYSDEYRKRLPEALLNVAKNIFVNRNLNIEFLMRQYFTYCSVYTHARTLVDNLEQDLKQRQYTDQQQHSWKDVLAAREINSKAL